jgi:hypothetical protein
VIIDELSFNQYPGYLLHSKSLNKVEIISNQRAEITLPENSLRYLGKLSIIRNTSYFKESQASIWKSVAIAPKDQRFQFLLLSGASGSGKSTLLRDLADSHGFSFEHFDCLSYFNIPGIKKLFTETIPETCNTSALIVELTNFEKYKLLIDQFSQGNSKSKRDLTEMRFLQTFQQVFANL